MTVPKWDLKLKDNNLMRFKFFNFETKIFDASLVIVSRPNNIFGFTSKRTIPRKNTVRSSCQ